MSVNAFIKESDLIKDRLGYYEEKMKTSNIFDMKFSSADANGNLFIFDGNARVQMDNLEVNGVEYDKRYRAKILESKYPVIVTSVDRITKVVHVSHNEAKKISKEELKAEIDKAISEEKPIDIMARIISINSGKNKNYAVVDIGGVGLEGVIRKKDWSTVYTSDIGLVARVGDIIKVRVLKDVMWNGLPAYSCSRGEALGFNPWEGINQKMPVGTVVNVTCISKVARNFFGKIDGINEINAYCEYPEPYRNITVLEGGIYQGKVSKVSEETKLLRIKIFKQIES